jgi:acetoin utilization deacetylase AcuC-like enzyme
VKAFYSDRFVLPLPEHHRFPMDKYRLLRQEVSQQFPQIDLREPPAADDGLLGLAHTSDYIRRLCSGDLSRKEMLKLGFPWSPELVERSRRSAGATVEACRWAVAEGAAVNLAGGTHHAYADRGEGFCCFNDAMVAARAMQREGLAGSVVVIDLDVHQGNGTASIAAQDPSIFTMSMHGAGNFPFHKECSDLDVHLPDGTEDAPYLEQLEAALTELQRRLSPDLLIYLAGADPYMDDRLGRLKLSKPGLAARDQLVFGYARAQGLPVAVAMAGGYARDIRDTVEIHLKTVYCAMQYAES